MQKVPTRSTVVAMALLAVSTAWAGPSDDSDREAARVATKQAAAAYNLDPLVRTPIFRKAFRCGDWRNSTGLA
jgi:hypothetical protein